MIVNCIAPMIAAELRQELDKANFASVTTEVTNRKAQGRQRAGTWRDLQESLKQIFGQVFVTY